MARRAERKRGNFQRVQDDGDWLKAKVVGVRLAPFWAVSSRFGEKGCGRRARGCVGWELCGRIDDAPEFRIRKR